MNNTIKKLPYRAKKKKNGLPALRIYSSKSNVKDGFIRISRANALYKANEVL